VAEQQNILIKILADVAGANASFGKLQKTLADLSGGTIALSKNFNAFQQGVSGSIGAQKAAEQVSKQYLQTMRERLNISRAEVAGIKAITEMHRAEAAAINAKLALQKAELAGDSVLLKEMQQELQLRRLAVQEIELENRERRALNATKRQNVTATNQVTGAVQQNTGAMGSASFAVLSLGQAFQDSAQFGMGFAQGLRAVNNNIQQTFTAIALGSVQMGGFNNLVKAMGKSLLGPGGLILGFSALSAAVEFFATRAQKASAEAKNLKSATEELLKISSSPEGIEVNLDKLTDLANAQKNYVDMLQQQVEGDRQSYEFNKQAFPEIARFYSDRINATNKQIESEKERLVLLEEMRDKEEALFAASQRLNVEIAPGGPDLGPIQDLGEGDLGERLETIKDLIRDAARVSVEAIRQMSIDLEDKNLADIILPEPDALDLGERLDTIGDQVAATAERMRTLSLETEDAILNFTLPEGELDLGKALETEADMVEEALDRMNKAFQNTVRNGITDMIVGLGELASGEGNVAQKLLLPIADMAIQLGKIAIGTGIALEGIKNAFRNLHPAAAIAAGVALVALGSAVKSRIKAAGKNGSSASSGASASRPNFTMPNPLTSPASFSSQGMFPATSNAPSFSGRLVASGRDLVAVVSAETTARQEMGFTRNLVIGG